MVKYFNVILLIIPGKDMTKYLNIFDLLIVAFFSVVSSFGRIAFLPVPFLLSDSSNVSCSIGLLHVVIHRINDQHLWNLKTDEFYKYISSGNGKNEV